MILYAQKYILMEFNYERKMIVASISLMRKDSHYKTVYIAPHNTHGYCINVYK